VDKRSKDTVRRITQRNVVRETKYPDDEMLQKDLNFLVAQVEVLDAQLKEQKDGVVKLDALLEALLGNGISTAHMRVWSDRVQKKSSSSVPNLLSVWLRRVADCITDCGFNDL